MTIKDLYNNGLEYIIMRGYGIDEELFEEILTDTKTYISSQCKDNDYVVKYEKLGTNTNFFFKKTIYQVKKNG